MAAGPVGGRAGCAGQAGSLAPAPGSRPRGAGRGGAPPPWAARGRCRPCSPRSAGLEADVTGSRGGRGHKGGFVGRRGSGLATGQSARGRGRRRGGGEGGEGRGWGRTPPPHTCQCPRSRGARGSPDAGKRREATAALPVGRRRTRPSRAPRFPGLSCHRCPRAEG